MKSKGILWDSLLALVAWFALYYLFPMPFLPDGSYVQRVFAGQVYSKIIVFIFFFGLFALLDSYRIAKGISTDLRALLSCGDIGSLKNLKLTSVLNDLVKNFINFSSRSSSREEMLSIFDSYYQTLRQAVESEFSMVRVIIWSLPLLGFIGTVVGVSFAIAGFKMGSKGAQGFMQSFSQVSSGLFTAFDTTFLGLVLVLILMFIYSIYWKRIESRLIFAKSYLVREIASNLSFPSQSPIQMFDEGYFKEMEERLKAAVNEMEKGAKFLSSLSKALLLSLAEEEKKRIIDELEKGEF